MLRELPRRRPADHQGQPGREPRRGPGQVANARITPKVSYTISGNTAWTEITRPPTWASLTRRSAWTVSGCAALNVQAPPRTSCRSAASPSAAPDAQSYREPTGMLNLGYRHKFNTHACRAW
ncbi:hypothetical protein ACRAWD_18725 [Caulobacter segnis]